MTNDTKHCISNSVNRGNILNNKGAATTRSLFWIVFLAICFYAGYIFVPPYATYYLFKTEVEDQAKLAHLYDNADLVKRMYARAAAWDVPIEPGDILITRDRGKINVTVFYVVPINVAGLYQRDLEYYVDVTKPIMDSSGILHN
ncbi:MAG: hypothetical protein HZB85_04385 [Deltaproteobacteria bacterium]|nr:hypothetical protein [Deltaproteobacteria bacterium]